MNPRCTECGNPCEKWKRATRYDLKCLKCIHLRAKKKAKKYNFNKNKKKIEELIFPQKTCSICMDLFQTVCKGKCKKIPNGKLYHDKGKWRLTTVKKPRKDSVELLSVL